MVIEMISGQKMDKRKGAHRLSGMPHANRQRPLSGLIRKSVTAAPGLFKKKKSVMGRVSKQNRQSSLLNPTVGQSLFRKSDAI